MDIKYLIANEETIDWKKLSNNKEVIFSALEAKLFKERIYWSDYIISHKDAVTEDVLTICKDKIFPTNLTVYLFLFYSDFAEKFIMENPECIDFETIFRYIKGAISEDALLVTKNYWEKIPNIKEILGQFLSDDDKKLDYDRIRLIYETL